MKKLLLTLVLLSSTFAAFASTNVPNEVKYSLDGPYWMGHHIYVLKKDTK